MKKLWEEKRLGDVCEVVAGQSPEGKYYNKVGSGLPFYQGKKEFTRKFIGDPTTWTTSITKEALQGDILMSVRAPVGPVNFAKEKICIGRGLAAIRATALINKEFLFYFLLKYEKEVVGNAGAVFNSINKTQIANISIPLFPLPEQKRIVKILDEVFEKVTKVKENAEKNLKNARELLESHLQNIFASPSEGWEEKKLGEICENLDSKRVPITKKHRKEGPYPYYGASGIVDYVGEYIFDEDLLLVSEDGANLLARTYPIALSISGKTWVNNHAHVLRFEHMVAQRFVQFYLNLIKLDDYVSGMAQPKLNQKMLNSIVVPFPKIAVQEIIVGKFDALTAETKKLEAIYQQKLADLDELKKSILQKTFNGELTGVYS